MDLEYPLDSFDRDPYRMSHSAWEVIRLKKARADSAKNAIYTRYSRAIIVAARQGSADPEANFALRAAIEKARVAGLPSDNIERAIKRGSGQLAGDELESIRYEGYGPSGVAVLMDVLTDNRNRTAALVREAFSKTGGNLGETGCVSWMFEQKGVVRIAGQHEEEELLLAVADAGGDDVLQQDSAAEVICQYTALETIASNLKKAGYQVLESSIRWIPKTRVKVDEPATAKQVLNLMDKLDALDDIQTVYANFEIEDSVLEGQFDAC